MSRKKVHNGGNHHRDHNPSKTLGHLWVCLVWINLHRTSEAYSESISTILTRQRRWVKERAADSHNVQKGLVEEARGRYLVLLANYSIHTGNFIQSTFSEISSEVWFSLHRQVMSLGERVSSLVSAISCLGGWWDTFPRKVVCIQSASHWWQQRYTMTRKGNHLVQIWSKYDQSFTYKYIAINFIMKLLNINSTHTEIKWHSICI